jgi:hypothetical protein
VLTTLAFTAIGVESVRAGEAARITLHDGLVWVVVDCGGTKLHFVVDTGAACSCVNLAAAKRLNMRLGSVLTVAGVGGRTTGYRCTRFQASVGGMRLPEEVVALDLSGPSRGCSEAIDGLIGADFFRGKVVQIDYARRVLSREAGPGGAGGTRLRFANGVICVPVAVNGGRARWTRLDTGCTDALDWYEGAICCATKGTKGAGKSLALATSAGSAPQAEVMVGITRFHAVPVKMLAREIFLGEAGLLGNVALSKYLVTIDGIGNRLLLQPPQ